MRHLTVVLLLAAACGARNTQPDGGGAQDCTDGQKNGSETGVDCGGSCPARCAEGAGCAVGADCVSGSCTQKVCAPSCSAANGGCSANATCANQPDARVCRCKAGYFGDGLGCEASRLQAGSPWPMFGHDEAHTGRAAVVGAAAGTVKWTFVADGVLITQPAIAADGTIYVGGGYDAKKLYAINPDGTKKWDFTCGAALTTPAIGADGTLYFGAGDNKLYALNPDGTVKWSFASTVAVQSSPVLGPDGAIYFLGGDNLFHALAPADGAELWSHTISATGCSCSTMSSPALARDATLVFTSYDGKLWGLGLDGGERFTQDIAGSYAAIASVALGDDGTGYVGARNSQGLLAFRDGGVKKWSLKLANGYNGSPALGADGTIYTTSEVTNFGGTVTDGGLYAVTPDGGSKWTFSISSIASNGLAVDAEGTVYVGSFDRNLYAIKADGTLKWKVATGGIVAAPSIGADGTVYAGSGDKMLYAIGP